MKKVRLTDVDLNSDYKQGPLPQRNNAGKVMGYDWDRILDGRLRFYQAGKHFDCVTRNFASMCRQNTKKRGLGYALCIFDVTFDLKYRKHGVLIKATNKPEKHKLRPENGGRGNGGGTPRRRDPKVAKRQDRRRHRGQTLA